MQSTSQTSPRDGAGRVRARAPELTGARTGPRTGPAPRGALRALAACAALALGGCHLVEADLHNLDELHHPDDGHKLEAALQSDFWFGVRQALRQVSSRTRLARENPKPEPVDDAPGECLELLVDLEGSAPDDPFVRARQVEWFARLAVGDPWTLSRERAVIGLGRAGARLGGVEPVRDPEPAAGGAPLLAETLTAVAEAVRAMVEERGSQAARRLDLQTACDLVARDALDVDGARRALHVTAELAAKAGLSREDAEPLVALTLELQRELVARALGRALEDPSPLVRGAALEASLVAGSDRPLAEVLLRLSVQDRVVAKRALDLVRGHGLPEAPERDGARPDLLVPIYAQLSRPDEGEVRVSAMRALGAVTDAGFTSLREEDWQAWWRTRAGRAGGTR